MKIKEAGMNKVKSTHMNNELNILSKQLLRLGFSGRLLKTGEGSIVHYYNVLKKEYDIYVVQPHDNLWKISKKFGESVEKLKRLNGLRTDDINVNQLLKIRKK